MTEPIASRLPALSVRLRRPEIAAITARLGDDPVPEALRWLGEGAAEMEGLERDYEETAAAFAGTGDRRVIVAWLARRGRVTWRDRLATRRRLGIDVIRERTASAIEAVGIREELLLQVIAGRLPVDEPVPAIVPAMLTEGRRWHVRKAAAEVLSAHAALGGSGTWDAVQARANAAQEHPWVRDACDGYLVAADRERALDHLVGGLRPRTESRHFLLRRLRVERLAASYPEVACRPLAGVLDDPSEHVGVGLAATLVTLGSEPAVRLLHLHAASGMPRVRAAVAEYLGRAVSRFTSEMLLGFFDARLPAEDHPLALRALSRAAVRAATAHPTLAAPLALALGAAIRADVAGDSTEAAAAARRACLRLQDPVSTRLLATLRPRIDGLRPGRRKRLTWASLGLASPPRDVVGAELAELSREDYGLFADVDAAGITLWRGDRLRFRAWRFLHELLHPAPNKRQSWTHTVGRVVRGSIRAPAARMAEVTATTTPGERTVIDRDGSWVPALPTVDDLLDLGTGARLYTAFGVTEILPPSSLTRRAWNRLRLTWHYPRLARLRSAAIGAEEPSERASYVRALQSELGVTIRFHLDEPVPRRVSELTTLSGLAPTLAWLSDTRDAILAPSQVSQPALAWFAAGMLAFMLTTAAKQRDAIRQARASIPLVIGGWGTRGKSGTERIKAGMFHGLGYPVFVKTTGCEAMFISARPGLAAKEIFIFRPHDKSSINEQADMVKQAAGMGARVMLWECMALRPPLVELLEQDWMRDDLVTLTNAFPDHEDMQGPAGHDIATVISSFMPRRSVAVTTEQEFLPVFRERARERGSELDAVDPMEPELLGQDLLDLFPYQEHPKNIALVARVAERLGLDRMLAIATMAEHVVPDLGVLRVYPEVRVHGRVLRFINGMSANERTGCVTNWRRTGCDQIDVDGEPDHAIVVVVNNRADRVARSEVFARIMVQDLSANAFVLIGTNLTGLRGYVEAALDELLRDMRVRPEGTSLEQAHARVATWFARVRVGKPSVRGLLRNMRAAAAGIGRTVGETSVLDQRVAGLLLAGETLDLDGIIGELRADGALRTGWDAALGPDRDVPGPVEVATPADLEDAWSGWTEALAGQVLHARVLAAVDAGRLEDSVFRRLFRSLFLRSLRPIDDPKATGDRIIAFAARSVMPGARVTVMGVQNIKGTGLDFAYRWVALGLVLPRLARARAKERLGRAEALSELLAFDDYGLIDSGTVARELRSPAPGELDAERFLRERVLEHVGGIHEGRLADLAQGARWAWWMPIVAFIEKVIDPIDAVRRYWIARRTMRELREHTISLTDASVTMQSLYARQKGGWLGK